MTITLYGIKNCDTVRKARQWLDAHGVEYCFHDFRENGFSFDQLTRWSDELGWNTLINKRGMTWRNLSDEERDNLDRTSALELMCKHPALIKRPLLDLGSYRVIGFDPIKYTHLFD